jgi:peptidoglycan/xylan/chitin deacetylase (PgdA/CDA1 family)|tara:strand:- start:46 stop:813 length:768 start_codon:yes stop_codon:yes gene_type:complete
MIDKTAFTWPQNCRGAISLTYDDALPCHWQLVAPALEAQGLRGTFYANILSAAAAPEDWRRVAARGHELGNHSIFHPCQKNPQRPRPWLPDEYDLQGYTPRRWSDEMRVANFTLSLIDGRSERSFGNTCCHTEIGTGDTLTSLDPLIAELCVAGRGPYSRQIVDLGTINYQALGHCGADGRAFDELRPEIDRAMAEGGWIIYMIHGVGEGTHSSYMDPDEHQRLVEYLGANRADIWTAPLVEVAQYLQARDSDWI